MYPRTSRYSLRIAGALALGFAFIASAGTAPSQSRASSAKVFGEDAKLVDAALPADALSGTAVSISGLTAVVGAPAENGGEGAAYVFIRNAGVWETQQRLEASDGVAGDNFGASVSIAGDNIAIGAAGRQSGRGAVYTFNRNAGVWTEKETLVSADGQAGDQFGKSVSIQGLLLVAGAPFNDVNGKIDVGSAYTFANDGTAWTQQFHIQVESGQAKDGDHLGWSVSLSGNTVLVGAPDDDKGNKADTGSVYVFVRAGNVWNRQTRIQNPDGRAGDRVGSSVSLFANSALFGSDGHDFNGASPNRGKVLFYQRTGTAWALGGSLVASDGVAGDRFGASVTLSGPLAVIGAPQAASAAGKGYLFGNPGTGFAQLDTVVASDNAAGDTFGASTSFDSGRVVVGAPLADSTGMDAGAAYVFDVVSESTTGITAILPEPSVVGQSYNIAVEVTAPSGTPGGTVDISDGDGATCVITLAAGVGNCSLASSAAGLHTISASYSGSLLFGASVDDTTHDVDAADTTTTIGASPSPSVVGQLVTLSATTAAVAPGNGPPAGADFSGTVDFFSDGTLIASVPAAASGVTTAQVSFPSTGTFQLHAEYSGDANYNASISGNLSQTVGTNLPPTADPQAVTTDEGVAVAITLTGSDPDSTITAFTVVDGPANGVLTGTAPNLTYTPNANFSGADSFTFTVSDELSTSAPATVSITVNNVDEDSPVAVDDSYNTGIDVPLTVAAPGVMANDFDPDVGDTITAALGTDVATGTLVFNSDGSFTFTPASGFNGTETFTYTVTDGTTSSSPATVTITVATLPDLLVDGFEDNP